MSKIVNKVAQSGLVVFDLEEIFPEGERVLLDIQEQLFHGLILKEKDFRNYISTNDWSTYNEKHVAITCSADAIIPVWAFMLLSVALKDHAKTVVFGTLEDLEIQLFRKKLDTVNWSDYQDARVIVKGCSHKPVPDAIYIETSNRLLPYVKSMMYGEPCSTVPLFKRK